MQKRNPPAKQAKFLFGPPRSTKMKDQKPCRFLVFSFYPCGFSGFTILQNATGFYSSCALFAMKMHTETHMKTGLFVRVKDGLQPLLDGIVI